MWFKKTSLPPLELRFNLPPDGTYPPRIVVPLEKSIWLKGENPIRLKRNVSIRPQGGHWLFYSQGKNIKVLVNRQEIAGEHRLQDSDYISVMGLKGIFQADPVANFRNCIKDAERNFEEFSQTVTITPTKRMQKWLMIDSQGISLDGGQHTAKWDEIIYVEFGFDPHQLSRRSIKLFVPDQRGKPKQFPAKLGYINQQESEALFSWITYSAPFNLNINKVSLRKNEGKQFAFLSIALLLGLSLFGSHPTGLNRESIERFISTTLAFTGHMVLTGVIGILLGFGIFVGIPSLVKHVLKLIVKNRQ